MIITFLNIMNLFEMEASILSLFLRASILYLGVLIFMRILIAEGASHALGEYTSVTEGFTVIVSLMFCNYMVNLLSYHIPLIEKLIAAPPIQIVKNGKLLRKNMRKEYLTEEELIDSIRKEGV